MLVDDEPSALLSMERVICRDGSFTVASKQFSAEKALDYIMSNGLDVVFSDIRMPGIGGLALVGRLARDYPDVTCVVISGYGDYDYVREAFLFGVEDYLLKPVDPAKLGSFLRRLAQKLDNRGKVENIRHSAEKSALIPDVGQPAKTLAHEITVYLERHMDEDNSIASICRRFSISQPYLSKIFKNYMGVTYNEFLISLRVKEAKRLLVDRQDLLIGTVAALVGFSNQFYFSKLFKAQTGQTPSEYRLQSSGTNSPPL